MDVQQKTRLLFRLQHTTTSDKLFSGFACASCRPVSPPTHSSPPPHATICRVPCAVCFQTELYFRELKSPSPLQEIAKKELDNLEGQLQNLVNEIEDLNGQSEKLHGLYDEQGSVQFSCRDCNFPQQWSSLKRRYNLLVHFPIFNFEVKWGMTVLLS